MQITQISKLSLLVAVAIFSMAFAFAQGVPGEAVITNTADLGQFELSSADTVDLEAGNITQANVETNMSTFRWVGLLGNVSGSIVLGDSSDNVLYEWSSASGLLVYASTAANPTWTGLTSAVYSDMPAYVNTAGTTDDWNNTFNNANESIGSNLFVGAAGNYSDTNGATWKTYSLTDGTNLIWAGLVSAAGTSYSGTTVDYQMIIPEDGTSGDTTATTYNLWVELV